MVLMRRFCIGKSHIFEFMILMAYCLLEYLVVIALNGLIHKTCCKAIKTCLIISNQSHDLQILNNYQ